MESIRDYLYHQEGIGHEATHDIVPLPDEALIALWLRWLLVPGTGR